jgi:hypothetical protein
MIQVIVSTMTLNAQKMCACVVCAFLGGRSEEQTTKYHRCLSW